jgi:hypothetical protein
MIAVRVMAAPMTAWVVFLPLKFIAVTNAVRRLGPRATGRQYRTLIGRVFV